MDNRPIGIFDSGVGGLTVAEEVMRVLPDEDIVYFGDTARVPYGSKSKETVTLFSKQIVRFLLTKQVKAVIVACNTASSNSLESLKETFSIPLFGVVEPGAREAVKTTRNQKIGVIGTNSTINSAAYARLIQKSNPSIQVFSKACPLFVPLAEEGWLDTEVTALTAQTYLSPLCEKGIDTLVLGCTHYPLLRQMIQKTVGNGIHLVDPAAATANEVRQYFQKNNMLHEKNATPNRVFYVSDMTGTFDTICQIAMHQRFHGVKVDLDTCESE